MIEAGMLAKIDNAGLINLANHVQVHYHDLSRIIKLGTDKLVVVKEFLIRQMESPLDPDRFIHSNGFKPVHISENRF